MPVDFHSDAGDIKIGSSYDIKWNVMDGSPDKVDIYLKDRTTGYKNYVAEAVPNTGEYMWQDTSKQLAEYSRIEFTTKPGNYDIFIIKPIDSFETFESTKKYGVITINLVE